MDELPRTSLDRRGLFFWSALDGFSYKACSVAFSRILSSFGWRVPNIDYLVRAGSMRPQRQSNLTL